MKKSKSLYTYNWAILPAKRYLLATPIQDWEWAAIACSKKYTPFYGEYFEPYKGGRNCIATGGSPNFGFSYETYFKTKIPAELIEPEPMMAEVLLKENHLRIQILSCSSHSAFIGKQFVISSKVLFNLLGQISKDPSKVNFNHDLTECHFHTKITFTRKMPIKTEDNFIESLELL